ncbi:MAG: hypothetical protein Q7T33_07370, partial [Dehalococcoidia bacterium]|nr:hypothetical protein [Dehalococcoidia bacterium]
MHGHAPRIRIAGLALLAFAAGLFLSSPMDNSAAIFTKSTSVGSNVFNADTLNAPTGLAATGGGTIALSWTATADAYASGHRVLRGTASGGPYTQIAEVTPRTTTTYTDSPVAGTYYYVARAFYQNWESVNSNEASATVSAPGISFRAAASAGAPSGTLTLTISKPAGTVQNDVMIASIAVRPDTATITA